MRTNSICAIQGNVMYGILWVFDIQMDLLILARRPASDCQQKKKQTTCGMVDFAVPADYSVKLKVDKKRDKYLDLAR